MHPRSTCLFVVPFKHFLRYSKISHTFAKARFSLICLTSTLITTTGSSQHLFGRLFPTLLLTHPLTVGQNNQEYSLKYWATFSSICSFACTAYSFPCSALLASLARSDVLTHSLAHSAHSLARGTVKQERKA